MRRKRTAHMQSTMCHIRLIIVIPILGAVAGCDSGATPSPAVPAPAKTPTTRLVSGGTGFYSFSSEHSVGGIDYACIHYVKWDSGDIAYMIWTDLGRIGGFEGDHKNGSLFTFDPDRQLKYRVAENQSEKDTIVTINAKQFTLGDGTLFLVSTAAKNTPIRQFKRDLSALSMNPSRDDYKQMVESDTELQDFFKKPNGER